jgi:hypothetical protein
LLSLCVLTCFTATLWALPGDGVLDRYDRPFPLAPLPHETVPLGPGVLSPAEVDWANLKINGDATTEVQNEEQVCHHPSNPANLVAVWRDFRLGYRRVGFGYSFDHGHTWGEDLFVGTPYTRDSDPGLTVDRNGVFHAVLLAYESTSQPNGFFVFNSYDGGMSWDGPYTVIDSVPGVFEDKELIACDRTGGTYDGGLYVSWTRFWNTHILLCCSHDGGESWDGPYQVSDIPDVQWSVPCVGADGSVHVAWLQYSPSALMIDRSTDGGITFGGDVQITPVTFTSGEINGEVLVFAFPALDSDISGGPHHGNLYVAFMEESPHGDMDIYFTKSTDGGDDWSTPVRLNDDSLGNGADQFHPWLCVDEQGTITVVFYDRRNGPGNLLMDLYLTQSHDGGETFTPNERVTSVSSDPTAGSRAGIIGEYVGVTACSGYVHPVWTDTREGNQDVYVGIHDTLDVQESSGNSTPRLDVELTVPSNPISEDAEIHFSLGAVNRVYIDLYDHAGRRIDRLLEGAFTAGTHRAILPVRDLQNGVYIVVLETISSAESKKLVVLSR